jgi:hypothetical protein
MEGFGYGHGCRCDVNEANAAGAMASKAIRTTSSKKGNKAKTFKWKKQRLIDKKNLIVKFVKKEKQKSRSKKIWISHTTNKKKAPYKRS